MKTLNVAPTLLVIAALLGACSSMPRSTSLLDQTRLAYDAAQANPKVGTYAPLQMQQAGEALEQANAAARRNDSEEQIDKLAYLAQQKIALTQEVTRQKSAEAEIAGAVRERDQMRLQQRTQEADQARVSADRAEASAAQSRQAAELAEDDAAEAQRQTLMARGRTADAQRQTQEAQARTATLEAQLADLQAKQTERGLVITLGDVLFGTDQAELTPEGVRSAQLLADVLRQHPQRSVLIEGFTDSTGSAAHNQALSERRASAVRGALQEMGVARDRVAMRGYGEAYPVVPNDTAHNRQLNRRVEIIVSNGDGQIPQR